MGSPVADEPNTPSASQAVPVDSCDTPPEVDTDTPEPDREAPERPTGDASGPSPAGGRPLSTAIESDTLRDKAGEKPSEPFGGDANRVRDIDHALDEARK